MMQTSEEKDVCEVFLNAFSEVLSFLHFSKATENILGIPVVLHQLDANIAFMITRATRRATSYCCLLHMYIRGRQLVTLLL